METTFPRPPQELIDHAGRAETLVHGSAIAEVAPPDLLEEWSSWLVLGDPHTTDERMGREQCDTLLGFLPEDWSWDGKRVLDFGCGYGRILRHFIRAAPGAELWGCDIHRPSIEWLERTLSPPLNVFVSAEEPPLPQPAGSFDLVYAISVFTHMTEEWSAWLLELRRLLTEDGLLIVTFLNRGLTFLLKLAPWHDEWDEEETGMHVFGAGTPWDEGGPTVFLSQWWIRAHWGRAFEILDLLPAPSRYGQGYAIMRKKAGDLTAEELEAPEPNEPRELAAARYSLRQSLRESAARRAEVDHLRHQTQRLEAEAARLERECDVLTQRIATKENELAQVYERLEVFRTSRSWRLTHPLRVAGERLRQASRRG